MTTKTKRKKVEAREAMVIVVGARAPEWRKAIVRDRHTGQLAEVTLTEYPPIDEGDDGRTYVFKRGERVWADHEAVVDAPNGFVDCLDDD